jgi:hypothetical protein
VLLDLVVCAALKLLANVVALQCEGIKTTIYAARQCAERALHRKSALHRKNVLYVQLLTRHTDCSTMRSGATSLLRCHALL